MKYLLDSNTCIQNLRAKGNALVKQRLVAQPAADAALCSVVVAELYFGIERSTTAAAQRPHLDAFVAQFVSLPFDDTAAREYARLRAELEARGLLIGANDLLIAAIALAHKLTLVTHDTAEFSRVSGLAVEDWEIP